MDIIKLSGSLCTDASPLKDVRPGTLIVHGGGPQLDKALAATGQVRRIEGLRVTDAKQAQVVAKTLDEVGDRLADDLRALGHTVHRVRAADRMLGASVQDERLQRVGVLTTIPAVVAAAKDRVTVVTPVGWDADGPLNVNADDAAAAIAQALGAETLCFLSDVDGVLDQDKEPIAHLDLDAAMRCIDEGIAAGGMVPKLRAAMAVARGGTTVRIGSPACLADPQEGTTVTAEVVASA